MKLLFILFVIVSISVIVYFVTKQKTYSKKEKKGNFRPILFSGTVALFLFVLVLVGMYKSETARDIQCTEAHVVSYTPPTKLTSAADYFQQGNYDYDAGNCLRAIAHYTKSIELDPSAQAYNNRAYTYMRLRNYSLALPDLDKALALKPDYMQALMNRGDIHNYYYAIDRQSAIVDYEKVITLGGKQETSVCGHIFLARHNGWTLSTFLALPGQFFVMKDCK